ncbi:MAG: hypothetical protein LBT97_01430 [Planctomycetota bacterium]|nr:hypothetical protein [Planctomycetota bacterium]
MAVFPQRQFAQADDRVHRGSDLVAGAGEKVAFGLVGGRHFLIQVHQFTIFLDYRIEQGAIQKEAYPDEKGHKHRQSFYIRINHIAYAGCFEIAPENSDHIAPGVENRHISGDQYAPGNLKVHFGKLRRFSFVRAQIGVIVFVYRFFGAKRGKYFLPRFSAAVDDKTMNGAGVWNHGIKIKTTGFLFYPQEFFLCFQVKWIMRIKRFRQALKSVSVNDGCRSLGDGKTHTGIDERRYIFNLLNGIYHGY